jgi:hypothetical protein
MVLIIKEGCSETKDYNYETMNPHSAYIDQRIADLKKLGKYKSKITETSHNDYIRDYGSNLFTNLVRETFTATYLKKNPCSDCGKPSKERCHGEGEDRPLLIRRALEKVYPDTSATICQEVIVIQFLEEHKTTKFTFKCHACHHPKK